MIDKMQQHYLLTEQPAEFPQFTGQEARPAVTVHAHAGTGGITE